jgi:hypothetical protein
VVRLVKKIMAGIVIGSALTLTTSVFADSIKEYILTKIEYPIMVNGSEFKSNELPALNYQGNTYLPLKAVGDVLGKPVKWNDQLKRVEIGEINADLTPEQRQKEFTKSLEDKRQKFLDEYKDKGIDLIDFNKLENFCATRMNSVGVGDISNYSLNRGSKFSSDGKTVITYVLYKNVEYPYTVNIEIVNGDFGYLSSSFIDLAFIKKIVPQSILDEFNDAVKNKKWGM